MKEERSGSLFMSMLAVAFIVLRLTKAIEWSWIWVLAPIWIPVALALLVAILAAFRKER